MSKVTRRVNTKYHAPEPLLYESGIRVARPVKPQSAQRVIELTNACRSYYGSRFVERHNDNGAGSTLLKNIEVSTHEELALLPRNETFKYMHQLSAKSAANVRAKPSGIAMYGSKNNNIKSLVVTFDEDAYRILQDDRLAVTDVMDQMSEREFGTQVDKWSESRPHLTVAKFVLHEGLDNQLPSEQWVLRQLPPVILLGRIAVQDAH